MSKGFLNDQSIKVLLVEEHNHNSILKEAVYPLDKKNRINIRKIKEEWFLKPPIMWIEVDTDINEDKDGWSDVTFEFCPELKITGKLPGKSGGNVVNKIMHGPSKPTSSLDKYKVSSNDEEEVQSYKPVQAQKVSGEVTYDQIKKGNTSTPTQTTTYSKPVETKVEAPKTENKKGGELDQLDQLEALADLFQRGILTKEEFDFKKKKILGL